jgi:D-psicose/D-tagatose/L-ribulose 3-epimerase
MRYGCCVDIDQIPAVVAAGFDFCELPARAVLPFEADSAALPALRAISAHPIQPESFNLLIPGEIRLCGPAVDLSLVRSYLRRAFGRMVSLGGAIAVLGSGAARRIPEEWPREEALNQLADALAIAGEEASRAGIRVAVEHLNRAECNVLNTIAECQAFLIERNLSELDLLADLYHIEQEQEPLAHVAAAASRIVHVHTAGGGRGAPHIPGYDYPGFLATLQAIGYQARISAECSWQDFASETPKALAFMRAAA